MQHCSIDLFRKQNREIFYFKKMFEEYEDIRINHSVLIRFNDNLITHAVKQFKKEKRNITFAFCIGTIM